MAYNFPNSPSNGDTVNVNGIVYTYNLTDNAWKTGTGSGPAILSDGSTPSLASGITAAEVRTLIGSPDLSSVDSDIIPDGDGTRDLGSSSAKFKDLHLSGNTLHLGAQTLQADSSAIILPELKIGSGSNQVTLSGGANGTLQTGGSPIFSGAFSALTGKPTTLAGYGITDGATTSYVTTQINNVIDSAPGALNTLNELAAALNDDANFSTTVTNSLATKAPLASAALTGTPTAPTASTGTNTTQIATTAFVQANKFSGAFSALTGKPTTIAGYGITDAFSGAFSALTGKPTTIAGYGITDAFSGAFSALTGKPTTVSGYGITDALTTGANANIGSNDFITTGKVYFANMFSQTSNLPSATTYHGMFAHVHATGAAYFAHGGNWIELANKSYVDTQINAVIDSAPGALDTLNELAAALNDDASFSTTVTNSLATKAPLASPSLTGTPTAPTASSGTNNTQIATTAFVQAAVTGGGSYNNASVDSHLNTGTASTNEVLSWNGSDYDWVAQSGGGGGSASVTTSDAAPSSPSAGDLWYNTSAGGLFVYYQDANSAQWVEVVGKTGATGAAGGVTVSIGTSAPNSPAAGQLWWNSSANKLYIYYTDANSSQWVQATTPGAAGAAGADGTTAISDAAPSNPSAGQLWWNSTTNKLYIYYTDANSSQWIQASTPGSIGATGAAGPTGAAAGRNKIINGNFDIWQRGTSFTASGYTCDRWRLDTFGGAGTTLTRQAFTLGQTDVPDNPEYYLRAVTTTDSSADAGTILSQRIEDVKTFAGQTITVSFYAKADAVKNINIELRQDFGSGGSPSSQIAATTPQKFALSTTWTKYTKTFSIASISGKTIGTSRGDYLRLAFWLDAGSDYDSRTNTLGNQAGTFEFAQVQVEKGSSASVFEEKTKTATELDCFRYYQQYERLGGSYNNISIGRAWANNRCVFRHYLAAPMRTNPSISFDAVSNLQIWSVDAGAASGAAAGGINDLYFSGRYGPNHVQFQINMTGTQLTAGAGYMIELNNQPANDKLIIDAEL